MRLLVTRPEEDAADTAARLRALGHEVLVQPLLAVEFMPPPVGLADPGAIVFTSRNGVRAVGRWPEAERWRGVPVFAVGKETAAEARAQGFADVRVGARDARSLADLVVAELAPTIGLVLYPAPREAATDLAMVLRARGFSARRVEAYRTTAVGELNEETVAMLREGRLNGALFFSRRTAAVFRDLTTSGALLDAVSGLTLFALSDAVAEPLRGLARGAIKVAAHPDRDSLFALLPPADTVHSGDSHV